MKVGQKVVDKEVPDMETALSQMITSVFHETKQASGGGNATETCYNAGTLCLSYNEKGFQYSVFYYYSIDYEYYKRSLSI
jgi:hypothetical protein